MVESSETSVSLQVLRKFHEDKDWDWHCRTGRIWIVGEERLWHSKDEESQPHLEVRAMEWPCLKNGGHQPVSGECGVMGTSLSVRLIQELGR